MIRKSRFVIPDAVIIITAHEQNFWELLCNKYQLEIPATIFEDEVFYFKSKDVKRGLSPSKWIDEGKAKRIEAEIEDERHLREMLSENFLLGLDAGELEAIAFLGSKKGHNHFFVTADRFAIKALGVLGWSDRGISAEELLEQAGAQSSVLKKLPEHLKKKWFKVCLHEGQTERHLWRR